MEMDADEQRLLSDAHCTLSCCRGEGQCDDGDVSAYVPCSSLELVVGTHPADWERHAPGAHRAAGLHPWWLPDVADGWLEKLRALLESDNALQVGEIGLDKVWTPPSAATKKRGPGDALFSLQLEAFAAQLLLAGEMNRSCSVHCVRAHGPLLQVLGGLSAPFPRAINLHSWSGSAETTRAILALPDIASRLYFGVSSTVNLRWQCTGDRKGSKAEQRFTSRLTAMPLDRILLETDLPATEATRAERCGDLIRVASAVGGALNLDAVDVLRFARRNLEAFLARTESSRNIPVVQS